MHCIVKNLFLPDEIMHINQTGSGLAQDLLALEAAYRCCPPLRRMCKFLILQHFSPLLSSTYLFFFPLSIQGEGGKGRGGSVGG